jgi:hypothetical protein
MQQEGQDGAVALGLGKAKVPGSFKGSLVKRQVVTPAPWLGGPAVREVDNVPRKLGYGKQQSGSSSQERGGARRAGKLAVEACCVER